FRLKYLWLGLAALTAAFVLWHNAQGQNAPAERPAAPARYSTGFKLTFGLKQKVHGRAWAGVLSRPERVRAVAGWHLDSTDKVEPTRWDITLRTFGGDTPEKAVILDVSSPPEQPVTIYTRDGDLAFKPQDASC